MREHRSSSSHRSDDPRCQSVNYRLGTECGEQNVLDREWILHVRPISPTVGRKGIANNRLSRTSTCFQLLYGRLSDIWSRKVVLLVGLLIFFLGSLAASLAQNVAQLIIFRAITGVGGGGLMTVAQIIVSDVVTLRERGKYQGILVRFLLLQLFESCD